MRNIPIYDDVKRLDFANSQTPSAAFVADMAESVNAFQSRYRPLFNFWGGTHVVNLWSTPTFRQSWGRVCQGAMGIRMQFMVTPNHGDVVTGQSVQTTVNGASSGSAYLGPTPRTDKVSQYPFESTAPSEVMAFSTVDSKVVEVAFGSSTANGPQVRGGLLYEPYNVSPLVNAGSPSTAQTERTEWIAPGSPIIGDRGSDLNYRSTRGLRNFYRNAYKAKRLHFGWSGALVGGATGSDGYTQVASNVYVYIHDQRYGETPSIAPTPTSPGITVPLLYSAGGRATVARLYFRIFAYMNGGTGTATFRYYHRSGAGMSSISTMTNPITVSGGTPRWWGVSAGIGNAFSEAADCHFDGDATLAYDRIILCAKPSAGATLKIGAWTLQAFYGTR